MKISDIKTKNILFILALSGAVIIYRTLNKPNDDELKFKQLKEQTGINYIVEDNSYKDHNKIYFNNSTLTAWNEKGDTVRYATILSGTRNKRKAAKIGGLVKIKKDTIEMYMDVNLNDTIDSKEGDLYRLEINKLETGFFGKDTYGKGTKKLEIEVDLSTKAITQKYHDEIKNYRKLYDQVRVGRNKIE